MDWDELLLFVSSVVMLFAITRRIVLTMARRNRLEHESLVMMLKATLAQFRADDVLHVLQMAQRAIIENVTAQKLAQSQQAGPAA